MFDKLRARARSWFFTSLVNWLFSAAPPRAPTLAPPAPSPKPSFDRRRELQALIEVNSLSLDTYFPSEQDSARVVDTHIGSLNRHQATQIADLLIASAKEHGIDLSFLTAVTFANARWSPEAYDHRLSAGELTVSFATTRWGIGLFWGSELRRRDDMRFMTEGSVYARACDPAWAIDQVAHELADHIRWAQEHREASTPQHVVKAAKRFVSLGELSQEEIAWWLAALAFHLRDRREALDAVWKNPQDEEALTFTYPAVVIETARKFAAHLTEPSPATT